MAGIHAKVYVQVIIAVRKREHLIPGANREELFQYIADIIGKKGQNPIIVNGFSNHVHAFMRITPETAVSTLVREIKSLSAGLINRKGWVKPRFMWQPGFGAFSYGQSQVEIVCQYLKNQENHHMKSTFREEYHEFLTKFLVDFREEDLFDWIGDE